MLRPLALATLSILGADGLTSTCNKVKDVYSSSACCGQPGTNTADASALITPSKAPVSSHQVYRDFRVTYTQADHTAADALINYFHTTLGAGGTGEITVECFDGTRRDDVDVHNTTLLCRYVVPSLETYRGLCTYLLTSTNSSTLSAIGIAQHFPNRLAMTRAQANIILADYPHIPFMGFAGFFQLLCHNTDYNAYISQDPGITAFFDAGIGADFLVMWNAMHMSLCGTTDVPDIFGPKDTFVNQFDDKVWAGK